MRSRKPAPNRTKPARRATATASPDLNAGRIVGVFGLRGECKIDATRIGADALAAGTAVTVRLSDGTVRELRVRSSRLHKGRPLAAFDGFDDVNAALLLVGASLALDRTVVELGAGEYLDADLIGCELADSHGRDLGRVVGVEHYPSQDMLVVGPAKTLIPMVAAFVISIEIAGKRIVVNLPPGLLDEGEADLA